MPENLEFEGVLEADEFFVAAAKRTPKIGGGTYPATIEDISVERDVETNFGGVTKVQDTYWFKFSVNGSNNNIAVFYIILGWWNNLTKKWYNRVCQNNL
ncbi:MAG: hypothetical protein WCE81_05540 [Halobacteriota archaeon]